MKIKAIICIAVVLMMMTSCSKTEKLIEDSSASSSISETSATVSSDETTSNAETTSSEDIPKIWSEWRINFSCGSACNLLNKDRSLIESGKTVVKGGKLIFDMFYMADPGITENAEDAELTLITAVNGKICDTSLGDTKSNNGMLFKTVKSNEEIIEEFSVSDCELKSKDNSVNVMLLFYYPQTGHSSSVQVIRHFDSDTETTQTVTYKGADRHENIISYTTGEDTSVLSGSPNFTIDKYSFDEKLLCTRAANGTPVGFQFLNSDASKTRTLSRTVLFICTDNGKYVPIVNDDPYFILPLTTDDLELDIPVTKLSGKGEYHSLFITGFDLNDEAAPFMSERLFCSEGDL